MGNIKAPVKSFAQTTNPRTETFDPALTSLFASSAGPVQSSLKRHLSNRPTGFVHVHKGPENALLELKARVIEQKRVTDDDFLTEANKQGVIGVSNGSSIGLERKRKRKVNDDDDDDDDNLESRYLQRLNREATKEETVRERRRQQQQEHDGQIYSAVDEGTLSSKSDADIPISVDLKDQLAASPPPHETLSRSDEKLELEKASRTVFLGNVSTITIKSKTARSTLIDHLESFIPNLPKGDITHKIESIRFRSTAFCNNGLPKKAAYAKKELMDSTTKSTNAYAVYTTQSAAREAVTKLNGTVIFDRHLRVDGVAHPSKVDHRRCVFVGNLGFVDDETMMNTAKDEDNNKRPRKAREPADAEEGLWKQFSKAGAVESVRVIRDKTTRVGKGFAYVQFKDVNSVEKALLYNEKKFPPMLPRVLRVSRAKRLLGNALRNGKSRSKNTIISGPSGNYQPKLSSQSLSLSGRAQKLLGNAGAAQLSKSQNARTPPSEFSANSANSANASTPASKAVLEGHRASSKQSMGTMKLGGSGKKQGKPRTRSSKRGAAFKASGKKKSSKS